MLNNNWPEGIETTQKKLNMKTVQNKSNVELLVTGPDGKQYGKDEFVREMAKNWTTWDITEKVLWIKYLHELFPEVLTDAVNLLQKEETENNKLGLLTQEKEIL